MVEIRLVGSKDYSGLANFLCKQESSEWERQHWIGRFQHWWEGNPAFDGETPRGWLLSDHGGEIHGFIGIIPSRMQINGKERVIYSGTTWVVDPDYREHGLALFLKAARHAESSLFLDTTPTPKVESILIRLKFELLPSNIEKESVFITNPEKFTLSKVQRITKLPPSSPVGKMLALPLILGIRIWQGWFRWRRLAFQENQVRKLEPSSEGFDRLWNKTRDDYKNTNVRDAASVKWYCFDSPVQKYVFGYYDGGELLGYIVLLELLEIRALQCCDLWMVSGGSGVLGALIRAAGRFATANEYSHMRFPHFSEQVGKSLKRCGGFGAATGRRTGYFKAPKEIIEGIRPENSLFVLAQGDVGI